MKSKKQPETTGIRKKIQKLLQGILLLALIQANVWLYLSMTNPGKLDLHKKLTNQLQTIITKTIISSLMIIQGFFIVLYLYYGLSQCLKKVARSIKYFIGIVFCYGIFSYSYLKIEQLRFQNTMETSGVSINSCRFPEYYPGWLFPSFLVPFIHKFLMYHMNQPFFEPIEPSFAVLQESSTSTRLSYQLTFPNCQLKQGDTPSYTFHPARVLLHEQDIPPIGSGKFEIKDKDTNGMDGNMKSLMGISDISFEGQSFNVSFSTPLQSNENSVNIDAIDSHTKTPVGLVQAFCTKKNGQVEEKVIPHVPEIPRLRQIQKKNVESPPSCPFSLTVVLVDSVSLAKAMRVWPKLFAKLNNINHDNSGKEDHLRTTGTKSSIKSSIKSSTKSSVFNFVRFHALGAFTWQHISTGFNVRPLFTGRATRPPTNDGYNKDGPINEVSWHRKVEETTGFWEEMREAHGHTSWWANGMCANYADYIDRKQMWTDVEFRALGCHFEYDQGGSTGNWQGPYSIFSRYIAKVPVHRHLLRYQKKWRKRYGPSSSLPTVGIINLLEAHEGLGQVVRTLDTDLVDFLTEMQQSGALKDTLVVLMADHGSDMGVKEMWKRESFIEKAHPFLTMIVPDAMLDRIPGSKERLTKNTQRLMTAYDLHRTFLSMCSTTGGVESSNGRQTFVPSHDHKVRPDHADGPYSLFHEEIPIERSCEDALIPTVVCTCHNSTNL